MLVPQMANLFFYGRRGGISILQRNRSLKTNNSPTKKNLPSVKNFKTQVNKDDYHKFVNAPLKAYLASKAKNFKAGQLSNCYQE